MAIDCTTLTNYDEMGNLSYQTKEKNHLKTMSLYMFTLKLKMLF